MELHHQGIACYDADIRVRDLLDKDTENVYSVVKKFVDHEQQIKGIILQHKYSNSYYEYVSPIGNNKKLDRFINTDEVYHTAYSVNNIEEALNNIGKHKIIVPPVEAEIFNRICFIYTKEEGLIELVETDESKLRKLR